MDIQQAINKMEQGNIIFNDLCDNDPLHKLCIEGLELLQKQKDGLVVELPCKIGTKLYDAQEYILIPPHTCPEIYEVDTSEIVLSRDEKGELVYTIDCNDYSFEDFGTILFDSEEKTNNAIKQAAKEAAEVGNEKI